MSDRDAQRIEAAMDHEDWGRARRLIRRALENEPDSHWLMTQLSSALYEARQYEQAVEWSRKALELAPHCPLVLWDLAGGLDMTGHADEAIRIWRSLLDRGVQGIADDECGEGKRWSASLVNDCRFALGRTLHDVGRTKEGLKYLRDHLRHRRPGLPSIYTLREVKALLRKAEAHATEPAVAS